MCGHVIPIFGVVAQTRCVSAMVNAISEELTQSKAPRYANRRDFIMGEVINCLVREVVQGARGKCSSLRGTCPDRLVCLCVDARPYAFGPPVLCDKNSRSNAAPAKAN